jgi:hypothetical protein
MPRRPKLPDPWWRDPSRPPEIPLWLSLVGLGLFLLPLLVWLVSVLAR